MATVANMSNMSAVLKAIWPKDAMQDLFYDEAPLLAMLEKDTNWVGLTREVPLQYAQGGGRSSLFAKAKANKTNPKVTKMSISTADNFGLWSVDHKLIMASRNDKGAVVRELEHNTKSAMKKFKRSLGFMLYGNGGGAFGQVDSSTTLGSTTLKFRNARQMRYVDVDDVLEFSTDDGTGGAGTLPGTVAVTAVDPESLSVTVSATLNVAITGITTSCYVFQEGDYGAVMQGLESYVPPTAPSSSIWGMARTPNKRRLGGIRVGGKGLLHQEAVKRALRIAKDESASISHIIMNTDDFYKLEMSLQTKKDITEKVGSVGFSGIEFVSGGSKPLKAFSDADCPAGVIWGLDMSTWTLASMGDYPDFLNLNGQRYEQEENSNSFEGRIGGYAQLYTDAPGYNFRLDMSVAP